MSDVLVFDVLSHPNMHQPFNEGYLRMLRAAFPDDRVHFFAGADHTANLARFFDPSDQIEFGRVSSFRPAMGRSRHHPVAGRTGAVACWREILAKIQSYQPKLVALLGFDANLLSIFRLYAPRLRDVPVHLILHNQIAEAMAWRSRNPLVRAFDLLSGLQRPIPRNTSLIALELGIAQAVGDLLPAQRSSLVTLEHPILRREWGSQQTKADGRLRIAFAGHCSPSKGFDAFCAWARENHRSELEFHAVGVAATEALDTSCLVRAPSPVPLSRADYVDALSPCDLVCLPLPSTYDYVASGSVVDAIAQGKPLFSIRNKSLTLMEQRYGSFGYLAPDRETLRRVILSLTVEEFAARLPEWTQTLASIRSARLPEVLARSYVAS